MRHARLLEDEMKLSRSGSEWDDARGEHNRERLVTIFIQSWLSFGSVRMDAHKIKL